MSKEQMAREKLYQTTMSIARKMLKNIITARGNVFRCFQQHSIRSVTSSNTSSTNCKPELEKQVRGNTVNYRPLSITRLQEKETESTNKNLS